MNHYQRLIFLLLLFFVSNHALATCTALRPDQAMCTTSTEAATWPAAHLPPASKYNPNCPPNRPAQFGPTFRDKNQSLKRFYVTWGCGSPGTSTQPAGASARFQFECPSGYNDSAGSPVECRRDPNTADPNKNCSGCPAGNNPSNPIQTALGTKLQQEVDIDANAGLKLTRFYSSIPVGPPGAFGPYWRHNFELSLVVLPGPTLSDPPTVWAQRANGNRIMFTFASSLYPHDPDIEINLAKVLDQQGAVIGWTLNNENDEIESYNANGLIQSIFINRSNTLTFNYTSGRLASVVNSYGRHIDFTYATNGLITQISGPDGKQVKYTYNNNGDLQSATYPDATPGVTTDNPVRTYLYEYNGVNSNLAHALTGISDENGKRFASWDYELAQPPWSDGLRPRAILSVHGPLSGTIDRVQFNFQSNGSTIVTDALGFQTTHGFAISQGVKRLASMTARCRVCGIDDASVTYDANGFVSSRTDFQGTQTNFTMNARGLETQRVESANFAATKRTIQTDWHSGFRVPLERRVLDEADSLVGKTNWSYNTRGQVLAITTMDPPTAQSRTQAYTYCEQAGITASNCPMLGLLTSTDGPRTDVSDVTMYTYYASDDVTCATAPTTCPHRKGDLWKVTNAIGQTSEILGYDGAGRTLSAKDANGVITDLEYSPRGWLTARKVRGTDNTSETDDAITRMDYDAVGQVVKVTQPDGSFTNFTYDDAHRLTAIGDSFGNSITYVLDNVGNRVKEDTKDGTGVLKRTLSRVYNTLGQLQTLADALSTPTDFTYDLNGNRDKVIDALGRVSDSDLDPLNRLKSIIANANGTSTDTASTQFQYDARDNLTAITDPKGLNTNYRYNGFDELTQLISPDTGTTNYNYDSAGNRLSQLDARGQSSGYAYDALNRLISQTVPTAAQNVHFDYDIPQADCMPGETFGMGRLSQIRDESGSTRLCYDRRGNLVRKVQSMADGPTLAIGNTFNAADRLAAMTYPSGAIITYQRNANGQIVGVDAVPTMTASQVSLVSGVSYLPFGPLTALSFGNGRVMTKTYDQNYGIGTVSDSAADGLSEYFTLNAVGNITGLVERDTTTTNVTRTFDYDGLDRLTVLKNATTAIQSFAYDATGNRLSQTSDASTTTYAYETTSHRLTAVGTTSRTYDASGNTTNIGDATFVFDDRNRLRDYEADGTIVTRSYRYNGKGERVAKIDPTEPANNRYYFYDEAGHLLGEYQADGTRVQEYVWLDDTLIAILSDHDGSTYQFVETDHLGTPRAVIHPSKNTIIWRWDLSETAFGEHSPLMDPDTNTIGYTLNLRYPGQYADSESQLNYNYFRDYEPRIGRYIESDPIGLTGGISTYGYVRQQPISLIDQTGLWCVPYIDETTSWKTIRKTPNSELHADVVAATNKCIFVDAWFIQSERSRRTRSFCRECLENPCGGEDCYYVWKYGLWRKEQENHYEPITTDALITYPNGRAYYSCKNPFTGRAHYGHEGEPEGGDGVYGNPRNPLGH